MRRLAMAIAAITLLTAGPVMAARQCASLSDQSAFEVQALRSELMVLATGCNDYSQYNAFINRYKGQLQANERAIDRYFHNRYGRGGQAQHDRFVTDLANALSDEGIRLGGNFCPRNGLMFNEVLSLQSSAQLPEYAAGKDLIPASIAVCTPMSPHRVVRRRVAEVVRHRKR